MASRIIGTGSYAPAQVVTNEDLAKIVETNDEWIRSRTRIGERHIAVDEGTSYMAIQAATRAVENAGIDAANLDIILLATSSPDNCFPAGACEVQAAIGAVHAVAYKSECGMFRISVCIEYGECIYPGRYISHCTGDWGRLLKQTDRLEGSGNLRALWRCSWCCGSSGG